MPRWYQNTRHSFMISLSRYVINKFTSILFAKHYAHILYWYAPRFFMHFNKYFIIELTFDHIWNSYYRCSTDVNLCCLLTLVLSKITHVVRYLTRKLPQNLLVVERTRLLISLSPDVMHKICSIGIDSSCIPLLLALYT